MTKLSQSKPVTRETAVLERTCPIVFTAYPKFIEIKVKGDRTSYTMPYSAILEWARKKGPSR